MNGSKGPLRGEFVVSWGQIAVDGEVPSGPDSLQSHRTFSWTGAPVRLAEGGKRPETSHAEATCAAAAARARVLLSRALIAERATSHAQTSAGPDLIMSVTDGIRFWLLTLLVLPELPRPLVLFAGEAPPPDRRLIIVEPPRPLTTAAAEPAPRGGAVCFVPGTSIATEHGPRLIEELVAGDRVLTRDNGAQDILWVGSRRISGARLHAFPDLRPVRIHQGAVGEGRPEDDLVVSPDHRLLVSGPRAQAIWGESEVLVAARDLIDDKGVVRAHDLKEVTYIHLLLPSHQILTANGTPAESFHPGDADLALLPEPQRLRLGDILPDVLVDPDSYGARARPVLGALEAAALIPRH